MKSVGSGFDIASRSPFATISYPSTFASTLPSKFSSAALYFLEFDTNGLASNKALL